MKLTIRMVSTVRKIIALTTAITMIMREKQKCLSQRQSGGGVEGNGNISCMKARLLKGGVPSLNENQPQIFVTTVLTGIIKYKLLKSLK